MPKWGVSSYFQSCLAIFLQAVLLWNYFQHYFILIIFLISISIINVIWTFIVLHWTAPICGLRADVVPAAQLAAVGCWPGTWQCCSVLLSERCVYVSAAQAAPATLTPMYVRLRNLLLKKLNFFIAISIRRIWFTIFYLCLSYWPTLWNISVPN